MLSVCNPSICLIEMFFAPFSPVNSSIMALVAYLSSLVFASNAAFKPDAVNFGLSDKLDTEHDHSFSFMSFREIIIQSFRIKYN